MRTLTIAGVIINFLFLVEICTGGESAVWGGVRGMVWVDMERVNGEANEYVYWGDHVASRLIWSIDALRLVGLGVCVRPAARLELRAETGWSTSAGESTMDDYDWQVEGWDWTDWSHHDDTEVTKAFTWEMSGSYAFLPRDRFRWKWTIGYRHDRWMWKARGGSYVYSVNGFRDTSGSFPEGRLVITYEQVFNTPYVGVEIHAEDGGFSVDVRLVGSLFVWGEAVDHHHLRDLVTYDRFYWGKMLSCTVEGGYTFSERVFLGMRLSYTRYFTIRGDSEWHYNDIGVVENYADLAGADLRVYLLSLILRTHF